MVSAELSVAKLDFLVAWLSCSCESRRGGVCGLDLFEMLFGRESIWSGIGVLEIYMKRARHALGIRAPLAREKRK